MTVQLLQQRFGFSLDGEEERLQGRLQTLNAQMNAPGQLKVMLESMGHIFISIALQGRLNELLSVVRCQPELLTREKDTRATLFDGRPTGEERRGFNQDIQRYLVRCQEGLETLVGIVERDMNDVKTMINSLEQTNRY
jgi:hypothetical protein